MSNHQYMTADEVEAFLNAAKEGEHGVRDYCMYLLCFRHGFRISELLSLSSQCINLRARAIFVKRSKGSLSTTHPLQDDEVEAYKAHRETSLFSDKHLFLTERGKRMTRAGAYYNVAQIGLRAGLGHVHPHRLRHACGYHLANEGNDTRLIQDYLGHKDINCTVRYTQVNHNRFKGLFGH